MKHWGWFIGAVAITVALGFMPFRGTDIAKLQPVELIRVQHMPDGFLIVTDTGNVGRGTDLESAFRDLKETASGEVFLETAEYLLIGHQETIYLRQLAKWLRPACKVCCTEDAVDLKQAISYLRIHDPQRTLQQWRAGVPGIPELIMKEGRLYLVP